MGMLLLGILLANIFSQLSNWQRDHNLFSNYPYLPFYISGFLVVLLALLWLFGPAVIRLLSRRYPDFMASVKEWRSVPTDKPQSSLDESGLAKLTADQIEALSKLTPEQIQAFMSGIKSHTNK